MSNYRFFTDNDFSRLPCTPACSISDMHQLTLQKLDRARGLAGMPFIINSAYRTKAHELSRGRNGTSSHITGRAVDIAAVDSVSRFKIVKALIEAGFNRIGVHASFIHADDDPGKPGGVLWLY
jgi:uncharacterized protein YcbK (DUF882 family)